MRLQAPYLVLVRYVVPVRYSNLFVDKHVPGTCLQQILPAVYTVPGILYQVYCTRYLVQKTSLRFVQPMAWWPVLVRILTGEGGVSLFSRLTCRDSGPLRTLHFFQSHVGTSTPKGGFCEVPYCCHNVLVAGNHGAVVYTNRPILPVILVVVVAGFQKPQTPRSITRVHQVLSVISKEQKQTPRVATKTRDVFANRIILSRVVTNNFLENNFMSRFMTKQLTTYIHTS